MDLFEYSARESTKQHRPLAERMRPKSLKSFVGQSHLLGEGQLIRRAIEADRIFSMILWGPPGCGKTTLAKLIAGQTRSHFVQFSAVLAGVKEIRSVIKDAKNQRIVTRKKTILFVDEIHRFNKAQQDAFLHHVESGLITLIGATTENPSFEVISPLMSRCRVIVLKALTDEEISEIIRSALVDAEQGLGGENLQISNDALGHLVRISAGDARMALNNLEVAANLVLAANEGKARDGAARRINLQDVETALQRKALAYDKSGEEHYNLISAFHKSMRGSDPDATLYWLARMLESGEDPLYIARRMVRFASEDVGNADPLALQVALNGMEAYRFVGSPEGDLALAQAAVYLATAPKSNSVYKAYKKVRTTVERTGALDVPMHIRNAPTRLMNSLGYGKEYRYAHDYQDAFVPQDYLPEQIRSAVFYEPVERGQEAAIKKRLQKWRETRETERLKKQNANSKQTARNQT